MIALLNDAAEGKKLDGMVLNHITRYICRLNPSERTDLEKQFMRQLQRVCLFTDLNDTSQSAAIAALVNRKVGEPDNMPFFINTICRKPSHTWRPNEVRLMQNRTCSKTPPAVTVDVVSVIPGRVDLEPQYVVFLNGQQRVEPTGKRDGKTATMYIFDPPQDVDTAVIQNKRGMRSVRLEGRLKNRVVCDVSVDHDELIAIVSLGATPKEGYTSEGCQRRRRYSAHSPWLFIFAGTLLIVAVFLLMKK